MPNYIFKGLDEKKEAVEGKVKAESEQEAVRSLEQAGYLITFLAPKPELSVFQGITIFDRIKGKDVVIFARQFSVMISANVSLVQALKVLVDQTENQKFKAIIAQTAEEVDGGARLSDTLSKYPKVFSNFFISVVRSGETSGKLDDVLSYLADEMEKDYDIMSKIKGAMVYPIIIVVLLAAVGSLMMIFVVPKLTEVMTESGVELPMATKILIGISDFMIAYWWLVVLALVIGVSLLKYYIATPGGKRNFDLFLLKLPIFGKLLKLIYLIRFSRSMNTLITGGVTISGSLQVASEVVDNTIYKELIEQTLAEVESGNSISSVFSQSPHIPPMVSQMLVIGEKTGKIDLVLSKISDFYTREANAITSNMMTLIEPIILVVMGVAVAVMVAAIIMPMYNMASQF